MISILPLFAVITQATFIAFALSVDAFTAGFAYGSQKIKIPFSCAMGMNIICSSILGLAMLAGAKINSILPQSVTTGISVGILLLFGLVRLFDSLTKSFIRKHGAFKKRFRASFCDLKFILTLYADPEKADLDQSKSLSLSESSVLAVSLSLDGIAIGVGLGLANVNILAVFLCSLVSDFVCILAGQFLGERAARRLPFNISWLGGFILICLALSRLG